MLMLMAMPLLIECREMWHSPQNVAIMLAPPANALNRANIQANKAIKFDCRLEGGTKCSFFVVAVAVSVAVALTVAGAGGCNGG